MFGSSSRSCRSKRPAVSKTMAAAASRVLVEEAVTVPSLSSSSCLGRGSTIIKQRPDVSASMSAYLAHKPRLQIGQPEMIRPLIRADRDRVAALVVRAVDQEAAQAGVAHLGEGDLLRASEH